MPIVTIGVVVLARGDACPAIGAEMMWSAAAYRPAICGAEAVTLRTLVIPADHCLQKLVIFREQRDVAGYFGKLLFEPVHRDVARLAH